MLADVGGLLELSQGHVPPCGQVCCCAAHRKCETQKRPETQLLAGFGEIKFPDGRVFGSLHLFDKQSVEKNIDVYLHIIYIYIYIYYTEYNTTNVSADEK